MEEEIRELKAKNKKLTDMALQLLAMYREEKEKQLTVMRVSAHTARERDKAKELQIRLWRETDSIREEIMRE